MSHNGSSSRRVNSPVVNAARVTELRHKAALTQAQLADLCKLSEERIGDLEQKNCHVHPGTLKKVAAALNAQPEDLLLVIAPPKLVADAQELVACNIDIVRSARQFLYLTGSRSRDADYLQSVVSALTEHPELIHRRILLGPPRRQEMHQHVLELLSTNHQGQYVRRQQKLGVAIYESDRHYPAEVAICMNERRALVVLPSIKGGWGYDTAVVFEDPEVIDGWRRWVDALFDSAREIHSPDEVPPVHVV